MNGHWLVCGTRKKGYSELVEKTLTEKLQFKRSLYRNWKPDSIMEGCCPDSADAYAEKWQNKKLKQIIRKRTKND